MKSSHMTMLCFAMLVAASAWVYIPAKRAAARRAAGPADWLQLVSAQFTGSTNSQGDPVTVVSFTVSNASQKGLVLQSASLHWMPNGTAPYGLLGGTEASLTGLPGGATTNVVLNGQGEVPVLSSNVTYRIEIPWWEEREEPSLLRALVEQVEFNFSVALWDFPPWRSGVLRFYSDARQAEEFERRLMWTYIGRLSGAPHLRVITNTGPSQSPGTPLPETDVP